MKLIIAGSRNYSPSLAEISEAVLMWRIREVDEVVCGMARGVDLAGKAWADDNYIPVKEFPADWDKYGKAAGPIRNKQMGDYADGLLAFRFQNSRGTQNMIDYMMKLDKPVWIVDSTN